MSVHRGRRGDFWSKVDRSAGDGVCWPWIGSVGSGGYGQVRVGGVLLKAHRRAWALANGEPVGAGVVVLHTCDNPACCNPAHLKRGTQQENIADMKAKGRARSGPDHIWSRNRRRAKGEANGNAKLTAADVRGIRASSGNKRAIAARYGVSDVLIGKVIRREVWTHIE